MNNTCQSCAAFCALAKECRAKSPQPVVVQAPNGQPMTLGVFPATRAENWCGEWRPADVGGMN